ncbi:transcription-repair coupling factor [Fodinicurvata sp. EGI_FJ10296]|uniref:transcription-repair coupling factor n=1 Tax=Fodinicurvata sp. EGI_FJ10296 TaxID=3231908 RepID=UPI003456D984
MVAFFAPGLDIVTLPAWDCLPYDRVSPNPDIVSQRINTLSQLAGGRRPAVVLTTVNAILQRLSPRSLFKDAAMTLTVGGRLDLEAAQSFLARTGYTRSQTVREPGEYAVRGDIVDIYPTVDVEPVRIDLFGEEIEKIRHFDPISQRTTGTAETVVLQPMSEVPLDPDAIARFRSGYREAFGAVTDNDPLYEAVSAGRRYAGMEHWLPLFFEETETLFDYVPDAALTLDYQIETAIEGRFAQIADFHEARTTMQNAERRSDSAVYKPLRPDRLYLTAAEWDAALDDRPVAAFSPFAVPDGVSRSVDASGRRGREFSDVRANPDANLFDELRRHIVTLTSDGRKVIVAGYTTGSRERLRGLMRDHGVGDVPAIDDISGTKGRGAAKVSAAVLPVESGFVTADLAVVAEQDIFGDRLARPARRRRRADAFLSEASTLSEGDLVVHTEHGVGKYDGIETVTVSGAPHDCLRLFYANNDKLFVPVENIEVLSRFGGEGASGQLDKLGGAGWQARKSKVKRRLKDMADELLRIAAGRELKSAEPIVPAPGLYEEFAAKFPFPETEDQLRAIDEVLSDLASGKPMDRLICGDVGFGKTEVALRAAFVVAMAGFQVAVVVPTTLLARQHFNTFQERFRGIPLKIGQMSRMAGPKETRAVKEGLASGDVNIVIGTHALLAKGVSFDNLGMVIVDEEQHFGVKQKEKLKALRTDVHVLTLTATPIPRTLQLSMSGVRDLSLIATPPVDRLAVRTFTLPFDPVVIREAILREHFRGGQTYYVCPRVQDLEEIEPRIRELVPEVRIVVAHGRMPASQLEDIMTAFYDGQFDVLLCTTIVESGLDVPSANTMILHRADMLGLAQMYQLRGRVGRSKLRGYAYVTYQPGKSFTKAAQQRLHVLETLDTLGAGFTLASHDMDIRGAGNLLGEEQSGHIREVGVELFQQMLEEAVAEARGQGTDDSEWTPQINLGMPVLIPERYVADLDVRLDLYRRIARLVDAAEIEAFAAELIDRFGTLPEEVENLLNLIQLKRQCRQAGVEKLDAGPKGAVIAFRENSFVRPDRLVAFIGKNSESVKLRPDHKLVYTRAMDSVDDRVRGAQRIMRELVSLTADA